MSRRALPHLVFSTRSPEPKSGSDFVRQVVARSAGVSEEVRREFESRADLAGAILHSRFEHPIYFFSPLESEPRWLFARAVSLGLYRKDSQHLLVHGLVLDEDLLDALEGNPFLLDRPELGVGRLFSRSHPGSDSRLPPLEIDPARLEAARELNRRRLVELTTGDDRWVAAAYGALAADGRVACVSPDPAPEPVERLLLHFHRDDRMELAFQTFYTHSRPLPYRILGLVPQDVASVRRQFRGLVALAVDAGATVEDEPTGGGPLGPLASSAAATSAAAYLACVEHYRLTHLSQREIPALPAEDAALVLRRAAGSPASPVEEDRLRQLARRGAGGLGVLISELERVWTEEPERFRAALGGAAAVEKKITASRLHAYLDHVAESLRDDERLVIAALLAEDEALDPGHDWRRERLRAWSTLVPASDLDHVLRRLGPRQRDGAAEVVRHYALAALAAGLLPPAGEPPYWQTLLAWMAEEDLPNEGLVHGIEEILESRPRGEAIAGWRQMAEYLRRGGQGLAASRRLLGQEIPLLDDEEVAPRLAAGVAESLAHGGESLPELAGQLHRAAVAEGLFALLAAAVDDPVGAPPLSQALRKLLERATGLAAERPVARACGRFLGSWVLAPGESLALPWILDRCVALAADADEADLFPGRVLAAAAEELLRHGRRIGRDEEERMILAVAACLDARGRYPRAAACDRELMDLAVLGRVLARHHRGEAARRLDAPWATLVSAIAAGPLAKEPPEEARWWHAALHDELDADPATTVEDPRFDLYLRLGWALWHRQPESGHLRAALALRLRRATALVSRPRGLLARGRDKLLGSEPRRDPLLDWHLRMLPRFVPPRWQAEAEALLAPLSLRTPQPPAATTGGTARGR